jgi:FkbM family methyltransferase
VTLLHLCAGEKVGIMQLHLAQDSSSLISNNVAEGIERVKANIQAESGSRTENVVVMPLDRFVNKEVALMKIDTQGFEYHVVLGLQHTVRKYLPVRKFAPVITYEDETLNPDLETTGRTQERPSLYKRKVWIRV